MSTKFIYFILLIFPLAGCSRVQNAVNEEHEEGSGHEEIAVQYTSGSGRVDLYAEAHPFVAGETTSVLSHFTLLPEYKPLFDATVTLRLRVGSKVSEQTVKTPLQKGIYSFDLKPESAGEGILEYDLATDTGTINLTIAGVKIFASEDEAHESLKNKQPGVNTVVFTKEQAWKTDFSTGKPENVPVGQVIRTTAQILSSPNDESLVTARAGGIVNIPDNNIIEGKAVEAGQLLVSVSGTGMAQNNLGVQFTEVQNNYEKAKADYERAAILAKDKIVSEKELLHARNQYENAKSVYDNLSSNFSKEGQAVRSPVKGYIKKFFVNNGQYVEAGAPLVLVSRNKSLVVHAEVQQKYMGLLDNLPDAWVRTGEKTYSVRELNGRLLTSGKTVSENNFLIPVSIQVDNNGQLIPGSFVELYMETASGKPSMTVPNSSLIEEQGNYFVYVQIAPELFEKREVITGVTNGVRTEILKGLMEDETVVTRGAMIIKLSQSTGNLDAHSGHVH